MPPKKKEEKALDVDVKYTLKQKEVLEIHTTRK
jgi:hypothetical protein